MKSSFSHQHLATATTVNDRVIDGCFLRKETTTRLIHLRAFQVESGTVSFCVTYQKNLEIFRDLNGEKTESVYEHPCRILEIEDSIPKQFLVSKEKCIDHAMIVFSEIRLPPPIQERLVQFISTESVKFSRGCLGVGGGGLKIDVKVDVKVERGVKRQVTATDCQICLTKLYSAVSIMELQCSHVFHTDCVMKWLKKNPSCPICRAKALRETVSLF